jgi:hypothetical protein
MLRGSLMKSGTAASETPDPLMRSTDDTTTPFFVFQLYTILHTCIIDILSECTIFHWRRRKQSKTSTYRHIMNTTLN